MSRYIETYSEPDNEWTEPYRLARELYGKILTVDTAGSYTIVEFNKLLSRLLEILAHKESSKYKYTPTQLAL